MVNGIPLHEALSGLRADLERAQAEHGSTLRLQIDSIELELSLELDLEVKAEGKASTEAKIPWFVVGKAEVGGGATAQGARTHRLSLSITPLAVTTPEPPPATSNGTGASGQPASVQYPIPPTSPLLIADNQPRIDRSAS
ncbi:trypco2 family protein [Glycomyces sp. NPDC021274]|uniref:trypco2 family protein n=1 Tax=Glycomyces sp. NPDC021274 TaxID=3155120 RepID=UPI0033E05AAE